MNRYQQTVAQARQAASQPTPTATTWYGRRAAA